ncbi:uroporphyrinogen-III synthase [Roseovarius sp. THAF27]|uniref:uroporphyrinogen-III synthase n=1 Tax=Roseovarius sp. THAF27 TaxID=2587850 RepID=UPI001268DF00|nr:uroporphyrinogen-III synthase [Roseovarius sp. THAF27]QFT83074.1 uroporphyrinogen-III synthase [Roseovarius sp. THAF27]
MSPLILITRPRDAADAFAADLEDKLGRDADVCIAPLLRIEMSTDLPDLAPYRTLIFTSAHAVESFATATRCRDFACYVVGTGTGKVAAQHGFDPVVGPGTGKELAQDIRNASAATPCLYLRGDPIAFDLAQYLNSAGTETHEAIVYRQLPCALSKKALDRVKRHGIVVAPVFSPRSAQLLLDALPKGANLHVAAISEAVAGIFPRNRAARISVAARPDRPAMLSCVAQLWSDANRLESGSTAQ